MKFNLSDFDWFKNKKYDLKLKKLGFRCGGKKGRDEKIIIPWKNIHLTLSVSDDYCDFHATDQGKNGKHRSIFCIYASDLKKYAEKVKNEVLKESNANVEHIIKKSILIDPSSMNFLDSAKYFKNQAALPPMFLLRNRKNPNYFTSRGRKYAYAFDSYGFFKGTLFFNHELHQVYFISAKTNMKHAENFVKMKHIEKRLLEEGLEYDMKFDTKYNEWIRAITLVKKFTIKLKLILTRLVIHY